MKNIIYTKWQSTLSEEPMFFTMMNEKENWSVKVSLLKGGTSICLHEYIFDTDKIGSENIHLSNEREFREAYLNAFTTLSLKL